MIKKDAPIMQALFEDEEIEVPPERREVLAEKGKRLYAKYCGTDGKGICAESFAEYHIWRGELAVARDLLEFLATQIDALRQEVSDSPDLDEQLHMTERLIQRIQALLGETIPV
jgi:hypothetical protein